MHFKDFKKGFSIIYYIAEDLGVDEYNRWLEVDESGTGGSVDDLIDQVQKEHESDISLAKVAKTGLDDNISQLKNMGVDDYEKYNDYYNDIVTLYRTVMNPPAGYKDTFGDKFDNLRDKVSSDLDEMDR